MKKNKKRILGPTNRFLIGLTIALSLSLLAFEWRTERSIEPSISMDIDIPSKDPEVLPAILSRQEVEKPKPKMEGPDLSIVEEIFKKETEEKPKKEEPLDLAFDPDLYGAEENLPEEYHPEVDFKRMELFPHTDACIGLEGEAMKICSQEEIVRLIKSRLKVPPVLFDIGGKHGVQLEFTVNKEGYVEDVLVLQQTNKQLADEAVKTLKALPKLNPALQNGMPVSIRMDIPIVIDIRE